MRNAKELCLFFVQVAVILVLLDREGFVAGDEVAVRCVLILI